MMVFFKAKRLNTIFTSGAILVSLSACNGAGATSGLSNGTQNSSAPTLTGTGSSGPVATNSPPTEKPPRNYKIDALLFSGSGTWSIEVASLEDILTSHGVSFQKVTSAEMNTMNVADFANFGLLIFPGGSGGTQAGSLSSATKAALREAVQVRGVSYVGFCAGAFIAVAPKPAAGKDVSYGLGIVPGSELEYYYLENQGVPMAMTKNTFADGTSRDVLWYGGPMTPNTPGTVVAKYPDGSPAISEMWSGNGFVMISGPHPAAPPAAKAGFNDSDGADYDLAWTLMSAALHQQPLPVF